MSKIKSAYDLPLISASIRPRAVPADVSGVSMTRQEFADECDVNVLMARYERTGVFPQLPNDSGPVYMDVGEVPDLMTALQVIRDAEAAFMRLPAKVRREFDNDAVAFLNFAQDPENKVQMQDWGLFPPEPVVPSGAISEVLGPVPGPEAPKPPASPVGAPGGTPKAP